MSEQKEKAITPGEINKENEDEIIRNYFGDSEFGDYDSLYDFLRKNSIENPMSREIAELIIDHLQEIALQDGGWRLYKERLLLTTNNAEYSIIAWGWIKSGMMQEHELDFIIIKEEKNT